MTRSRRMMTAVAGVTIIGLGMPAAFAVSGALPHKSPAKPAAKAAVKELVVNGGFEDGTTGWKVNRTATQGIATGKPAASGAAAARLTSSQPGTVIINDEDPTLVSTTAGAAYALSAIVRSVGGDVDGRLRIREVSKSGDVTVIKQRFIATDSWTPVELTYVSAESGAKVDLNVLGRDVPVGTQLLVDEISMTPTAVTSTSAAPTSPSASSSAATPTTSPTKPSSNPSSTTPSSTASASTTPASPTSSPAKCVSNPMGIPPSGQTYLGAAVSGSTTIESREAELGAPMRIHRTYFSSGQISAATRQATEDLSNGRLPWISFKPPASWASMAAGSQDAWAKQLATSLATVPGPVWLAVHHEPEDDNQAIADWTAMQRRIAPIVHANTNNVAYTVIYSSWPTFGSYDKNTIPSKWPGDANVDVVAMDAYDDFGVVRNGKPGDSHLDMKRYYAELAAWAKSHGTAWAVAEAGQNPVGSKDDPTWLLRAYRDMKGLGGAALSYYDSSLNSTTDWTLDDKVKFNQFKTLQSETAKLC